MKADATIWARLRSDRLPQTPLLDLTHQLTCSQVANRADRTQRSFF
jgi:hypothetical protein